MSEFDMAFAFHAALLRNARKTLEETICIVCRLNMLGCRCTNEDLKTYFREHPVKVKYA